MGKVTLYTANHNAKTVIAEIIASLTSTLFPMTRRLQPRVGPSSYGLRIAERRSVCLIRCQVR